MGLPDEQSWDVIWKDAPPLSHTHALAGSSPLTATTVRKPSSASKSCDNSNGDAHRPDLVEKTVPVLRFPENFGGDCSEFDSPVRLCNLFKLSNDLNPLLLNVVAEAPIYRLDTVQTEGNGSLFTKQCLYYDSVFDVRNLQFC